MNRVFDVKEYWLERGENYLDEALPYEYHRLQERFLCDVLRTGKLPLGHVLELGCGFGRITRLLAKRFPQSHINASDLSQEQLANARRLCAVHSNVSFSPYDFYSSDPFPGGDSFDLVIAVEVFLHHPAEAVVALLQRLSGVVKFIVN